MAMARYTGGMTPHEEIAARLPDEYAMTLTAPDRAAMMTALSKFISPRRAAGLFLSPKRPGPKRWAESAYLTLFYEGSSVKLRPQAMLALLDALHALEQTSHWYAGRAGDLRRSILFTLGIEEV